MISRLADPGMTGQFRDVIIAWATIGGSGEVALMVFDVT
jgi:hypothetical protein